MTLKRFRIEKLIRDHLPGIMRQKGIIVHDRIMDREEFVEKLKDKLQEEAEEVKNAQDENDLTEELADMLEVIYALSEATGITLEDIEKARLTKRELKGGFSGKIYNRYVDIDEDNPSIQYYLERAEHYPLVEAITHKSDCLFCQIIRGEGEVKLLENFPHCYAIKDEFPVSNGHVLIIPKEHTENWFTASDEVRLDMIKALHFLKDRLDLEFHPDGYNIGANCGEVAGQSVMHLHLHLIPRYKGDMENPKGGVRGVIPSKQNY